MKTQMQDTSLESFNEIKNNGTLGKRERQVYEVIRRLGSCPISIIAKELKLFPHKITGRLHSLRNKYKVVGFDKKDYCPLQLERNGDKRLVCFWKVIRDFDTIGTGESKIYNNVVGKCFKCGCLNCECEVLE